MRGAIYQLNMIEYMFYECTCEGKRIGTIRMHDGPLFEYKAEGCHGFADTIGEACRTLVKNANRIALN